MISDIFIEKQNIVDNIKEKAWKRKKQQTRSKICLPKHLKCRINTQYDTDKIIIFSGYSKVMTTIDLNHLNSVKNALLFPDYLNCQISMCKIPNEKVFCFENVPNYHYSFTINPENKIEILGQGLSCYCSGSIYYNNCVYCFGGVTSDWEILRRCAKFDLNTKKWEYFTSMPTVSTRCSCAIFQNKIFVSGYHHHHLYEYDPISDSYTEILINLKNYFYTKILCANENRVILIEACGNIYEADKSNPYNWRNIGISYVNPSDLMYYGIYYQDSFYFIMKNCKLYKFEFLTNISKSIKDDIKIKLH
ncbi:unnamed protein product [Blepharisma stoltei]|uniref:Uncharacterized protein n=1 Tax=Blepharisma stoltei TaxID=1481888 RepID=A0AAU9KBK8_9CILI|nr:unnamed protein product [Blepharisma stoltei]